MNSIDFIELIHGDGGSRTDQLIQLIQSRFTRLKIQGGLGAKAMDDSALIPLDNQENFLAFSTDSHTIKPLFYPGGNIGHLAVAGTVNDIAVMGATPTAIASAFVIEEHFPVKGDQGLNAILKGMDNIANEAEISIIAGDTKVMPHGELDGMVITTTGLGFAARQELITDGGAKPGDKLLVTGTIGDHGLAVLIAREQIEISTDLKSDVAPLAHLMKQAKEAAGCTGDQCNIHAAKDITRGGLAAAVNDIARASKAGLFIEEEKIPFKKDMKGIADMLGLDPLNIANEGKIIMAVDPEHTEAVLSTIRAHKYGRDAVIIGEVRGTIIGKVILETEIGAKRILQRPLGAPIPRIC
ncbi:MAG: hydrogenase expression/formation protein HypE [Candidatus Hermodarchaeota archaeon]